MTGAIAVSIKSSAIGFTERNGIDVSDPLKP
jgi:hypothetical protein